MAPDTVEIETKYDVPADAALPDLTGLPGIARTARRRTVVLEATYFDTADLRLATARTTCRRRTGGDDEGWHLKLPAVDGSARIEVRRPLGRATRTVPKALRDVVVGLTRGSRLEPVAVLTTRRTVTRLLAADRSVLAEVCDDEVTARAVGLVDGAPTEQRWREWEVELVDGDRALLGHADTVLREVGAQPAGSPSKLRRALGARLPGRPDHPGDLSPDASARAVVHARLAEQADRLLTLDPLVRRDAEDAVHQARVAARRLRSALATYRPLLDRALSEPVREELRRLGRLLGEARDLEVLEEHLLAILDAEPEVPRDDPFRRFLVADLDARRAAAHADALSGLDDERHLALLDAVARLGQDPPWSPGGPDEPATDRLRRRVRKDLRRVRRRAAVAREEASDPLDPHQRAALLHEVRKAAKRLRYAAETLEPLHGADARRLARAAKALTSHLGDVQDAAVAKAYLRDAARRAAGDGVDTFAAGLLWARCDHEQRRLDRSLDELLDELGRRRHRRWL